MKRQSSSGGSSIFFENRLCGYYPCHGTLNGRFNCLFCFCPLYHAICEGMPKYVEINGCIIKDCSECDFPHRPENYASIIEHLRAAILKGL